MGEGWGGKVGISRKTRKVFRRGKQTLLDKMGEKMNDHMGLMTYWIWSDLVPILKSILTRL